MYNSEFTESNNVPLLQNILYMYSSYVFLNFYLM